ncbi:EAL domain-containing protein [Rhodoferax sp. GW822-FHT02A01]|uniref:EAL domain-containing protein n=1 Tax=Rhodoferax sp. GW822-FHT02A01 TaxID=3141537 RepID=UPI00315CE022
MNELNLTPTGEPGRIHGIDALTGLPGREGLLRRVNELQADSQAALICIDLDQLSALNETLGLSAGDVLLVEAAHRIAKYAKSEDYLVRYGGDKFGLLLTSQTVPSQIEQIATALIEALRHPYLIAGREVYLGASIGLAFQQSHAVAHESPDGPQLQYSLLRHAEAALARAKLTSRGSWISYAPDMNRNFSGRLNLESELYQAIELHQFLVYYQPKASCKTGEISGFEALIRWQHPEKGVILPSEFIPTLENTGLIERVGAWVLRAACQQLKDWDAFDFERLKMAVNVSLRQLNDPLFPELVATILADTGLTADRLELELTESMLMHDVIRTESQLFRLKKIGVKLSIDDFGTGYSSLAYLKRLPIDTVKVDRAFVQDITTDPDDASITRAIISMAHSLKMAVVAEGIETDAQLSTLINQHCDMVQGYFIGKPMPSHDALALLQSGWVLAASTLGRPAKTRTLLLVDDEDSILSALKRLLRREGYRILSANSGAQGLEILAANDVDVIVSDQRMPNMTGEEFLRRTKDLYPETMRLVLSGYADMESITNAINQGAIYKFMSKPWDEQLLRECIAEAFRHKEMSDENHRLTAEVASKNQELLFKNQTLARLLDEQSHQSVVGLAALSASQETLHWIPVPIVGVDSEGLIVLRNAAFAELNFQSDIASLLLPKLPAWPNGSAHQFELIDANGAGWRVVGRHLVTQKQHRGTVFAFLSINDRHE